MAYIVLTLVILGFLIAITAVLLKDRAKRKRENFIKNYIFPKSISRKLIETYPHLSAEDTKLVLNGLKEYFHICNVAGKRMVSMPSQAVDVAWHEFILFTRNYDAFCKQAFGHFLHHTPAEAMQKPRVAQTGIKTAWRLACNRENISPNSPERLPILFAIDASLNIPDGFKYSLNCKRSDNYCASHIGCGSNGSAGDCASSGCSGGCGGGD